MTEDTIFRLYSMTKPIVCTALMTCSRRGGSGSSIRLRAMYRPSPASRDVCRGPVPIKEGQIDPRDEAERGLHLRATRRRRQRR
jgi:hypothetical protein